MKFHTKFLAALDTCADENLHMLSHIRLLMLVHIEKNCMMSYIAERIGLSSAAMTSMADRLESMGLIERASERNDRRVNYLVLTDKGREFISKLKLA